MVQLRTVSSFFHLKRVIIYGLAVLVLLLYAFFGLPWIKGFAIAAATPLVVIGAAWLWRVSRRRILDHKSERQPAQDQEDRQKRGTVTSRSVRVIAEIVFFVITIPISIVLWGFHPIPVILVLLALWELLSYVVVHPVEFANRISFGERVPIGENGILKEGVGRKWPWEQVEYFDHVVKNHQGDVEVITATGTNPNKKGGRGSVVLKFTYQSRPNADVGDAQKRLRYREMDATVIEGGVSDRIESELITIASVTSLDDFLESKEALETIARCVVELVLMPHEDEEFRGEVFKDDHTKDPKKAIAPEERLSFYNKYRGEVRKLRLENATYRKRWSGAEESYGIDIIQFMLTSVLPSDAVKKALESERKAEALVDAIKRFSSAGYSLDEAKRLALASSGLSVVHQIDVSGSGTQPLVVVNPGSQPR